MMNIALLSSKPQNFNRVYTEPVISRLKEYGSLSPIVGKNDIEKNADFLRECRYAFSTWGMPALTSEEISCYLPKLEAIFYAAGTVQSFAAPFLESGVRVFSAYAANAVPVAEYTFSQIILALKGFFQASKRYRIASLSPFAHVEGYPGCFGAKVGLIGLGAIGSAVAEKLKSLDVTVFGYDPFVSAEKAEALGVTLTGLYEIFTECDVISNHLANKPELVNVLNDSHFKLMKRNSTFINTGRGAQVDERALARSLRRQPSRTAVLDVIKNESKPYTCPLFRCSNAIITPHIAGSSGNEVQRMAYYMLGQFENVINGAPTQYEVTAEMLKTMA